MKSHSQSPVPIVESAFEGARLVVENYHEYWVAQDLDAVLKMFHPDIEYLELANNRKIPKESLSAYVSQAFPQGPSHFISYTDAIRVAGNTAFIQYESCISLQGGQLAYMKVCEVVTIKDGLVWKVHEYTSRLKEQGAESIENRLGLNGKTLQLLQLDLEHYFRKTRPHLDADISLPKVSAALGYTRNQVSYLLNKVMHVSFYDYVNSARIDDFCNRMQSAPGTPINDLIVAVGFNSTSVFYRCFRKRTGLSPKQWLSQPEKNS